MRGAVGAVAQFWKDYMAEPMPGLPVDQQAALGSELPASLATSPTSEENSLDPPAHGRKTCGLQSFPPRTSITAAPTSSVILSSGLAAQ